MTKTLSLFFDSTVAFNNIRMSLVPHSESGTRADPGLSKRAYGERVEREPITEVWGGAPSRVQGQRPTLVGSHWSLSGQLARPLFTDQINTDADT